MSAAFATAIELFLQSPWLFATRLVIGVALVAGLLGYRRLYRKSARAAQLNAELIDNLSEGVYRSLPDGQQIAANRALVKLNGYETEAELLRSVKDIAAEWYVDPDRRAEFKNLLLREGRVEDFVSEIYRHKTRERIWISESARLVRDERTNEILWYEGSVREITDSVRRQELEERFRKLTDLLPGGLFQLVRHPDGRFAAPYLTSGFCRTVGIDETTGIDDPRLYLESIHAEDLEKYLASLQESGETLQTWSCEFRINHVSGQVRWLHVIAQPEINEEGVITWHGYLSDITERKQQEFRIAELAYFDALTKLPNRRVMIERMSQIASECRRYGRHAALLYIDLDHFKELNDTHGHDAGDAFLVEVAKRLRESVRSEDTVARIGGDEFVVILNSMNRNRAAANEAAFATAKKLLTELRRPFKVGRAEYKSGASIGAVTFDGSEPKVDEILKQADLAMYDVKSGRRDEFAIGFQPDIDSESIKQLSESLEQAIAERQLQLFLQPQVDRYGHVVAAEGLLRWLHPDKGLILPRQFVSLAKTMGLSVELDLLAVESAIRALAEWKAQPAMKKLRLSVNFRTSTLLDQRTPRTIATLLREFDVDPTKLTLELTESSKQGDHTGLRDCMSELKKLGIRFSLDDFGSGYGSITYLKQMRFDEVKIDGKVITEIDRSDSDGALVKTILAMAETLGLTAVAEHVENEQQEAFLRAYGCDLFQGYLYSGALPVNKFSEFAEQHAAGIDYSPDTQETDAKVAG